MTSTCDKTMDKGLTKLILLCFSPFIFLTILTHTHTHTHRSSACSTRVLPLVRGHFIYSFPASHCPLLPVLPHLHHRDITNLHLHHRDITNLHLHHKDITNLHLHHRDITTYTIGTLLPTPVYHRDITL